jgi:hypothetical protein
MRKSLIKIALAEIEAKRKDAFTHHKGEAHPNQPNSIPTQQFLSSHSPKSPIIISPSPSIANHRMGNSCPSGGLYPPTGWPKSPSGTDRFPFPQRA